MVDSKPSQPPPLRALSKWKKCGYAALAFVLFFSLLEALLFLLGVTPSLYDEDPYLGFSGSTPLFVAKSGEPRMETARNKQRWFNYQTFLIDKAPDTLRIFCLGGSTTYGRPYEDPHSFCGWLREYLPEADSSKQYEVINAGGISYASYRLSHLMEELIEMFFVRLGKLSAFQEASHQRKACVIEESKHH